MNETVEKSQKAKAELLPTETFGKIMLNYGEDGEDLSKKRYFLMEGCCGLRSVIVVT